MPRDVQTRRPFQPLPLQRWPDPFDGRDWLFELKYDGFRALASIQHGVVRLVSRTGYQYGAFAPLCDELANTIRARAAVLDGELTCLGVDGRPDFKALLYRRRQPYFHAFDLLSLDGEGSA